MSDEKTGEGLIRIGSLTQAQVDDVMTRQKQGNGSLFGVIALELGYVDEETLLEYFESRGL